MKHTFELPRLVSRHHGLECSFEYAGASWRLRRNTSGRIGDDEVVRYGLFLGPRELDPFELLGRDDWSLWDQLPYRVPHSQLCPRNVPSKLLCDYVEVILQRYSAHPNKANCFWPLAA